MGVAYGRIFWISFLILTLDRAVLYVWAFDRAYTEEFIVGSSTHLNTCSRRLSVKKRHTTKQPYAYPWLRLLLYTLVFVTILMCILEIVTIVNRAQFRNNASTTTAIVTRIWSPGIGGAVFAGNPMSIEYVVDGETFYGRSRRSAFGQDRDLRVGSEFLIYYNPDNPSEIIENPAPTFFIGGLVSLMCTLAVFSDDRTRKRRSRNPYRR